MRSLLKLIAVGAVVGVFALDDGVELALGGSALLVIVAYAIHRMDRLPAIDPRITHRVLPIACGAQGDIEGKTVRAPRPAEVAYQMHQRYAPSFDQQLAVGRHIDRHGDERYAPAARADTPALTYEQALERAAGFADEPPTETDYARLFDEQLALHRKPSGRLARGSYTPTRYAAVEEPSQARSQRPSQEGPAMVRPTARRV